MGIVLGDEPGDLARARFVVGLCDRFRCLPDEGGLFDQDAELLRMLKIIELAGPEGAGEVSGYDR
jgi:hypothetical protein